MAVTVHLKNLRVSPRKVRLVVDVIRGLKVDDALDQLNYIPKRAAAPIAKLLQSGIAAAEHDFKMDKQDLIVTRIIVEEGQTLKRTMPRAMGRAFRIAKRTSHITLVLDKKTPVLGSEALLTEGEENKEKNLNKEK